MAHILKFHLPRITLSNDDSARSQHEARNRFTAGAGGLPRIPPSGEDNEPGTQAQGPM